MDKEEIENMKFEASIPLLTQEEINGIDINMNEIINKFTKMFVKEKDLAIAQHIIKRQQEKIEELEQKESILSKVTDKLKEDIKEIKHNMQVILLKVEDELTVEDSLALENQKRRLKEKEKYLKIIEGEENG